jgi:hypothetical protein
MNDNEVPDGSELSRDQHQPLYDAISEAYGTPEEISEPIAQNYYREWSSLAMLDENHQVIRIRLSQAAEWEEWYKQVDNRRVGRDIVEGILVSTVFLCIDHGFGGEPKWFETMLFKGEDLNESLDEYQWRYATWEEARKGHEAVVELVRVGEVFKKLLRE